MKGYENYKDSGVEWVGKIPEHWDISKYKFAVNILSGFPFKSELFSKEKGFPLIRIRDISSGNIETFYDGDYSEDYIVKKDDLVVGMDGDFNVRWWNNVNALLNQRCCSIKSIEEVSILRFLFYVIPNDLKVINDLAYFTTVKHLSNSDLYNRNLILPSLEEQTKITAFLDYKTNLIDDTIEKKKRLIELLKEKRQAVINEAVTKGLNPNAPMKESGVEWLGEIPENWSLVPLRYLYNKIGSGVTPKGGGDVYVDEGVTFIRSQNVHFEGLRLDDVVKIDTDTHQKMYNSHVEFNDVLLNITGASIGRCCVVNIDEDMNVNQHVCIIRVNEKINPDYLNVVLQSNVGQIQIKLLTTGGNREGLTHEAVKNLIIPLPHIETQIELLKNISQKLNTYDLINKKILENIQKLQTYRQSLISEAVTGKIDVRDWQSTTKKA